MVSFSLKKNVHSASALNQYLVFKNNLSNKIKIYFVAIQVCILNSERDKQQSLWNELQYGKISHVL